MKILIIVTLLVGTLMFMGYLSESKSKAVVVKPLYSKNLNQNELVIAKKAFEVFCQTCHLLTGKYAEDVETVEVSHGFNRTKNGSCMDYRCDDYGWDRQIYIKVKIKDRTKIIPDFRGGPSGHTLHFYLGGPKNPGITTTKFPEFCGVQKPSNGNDTFISVPSLSFIKQ